MNDFPLLQLCERKPAVAPRGSTHAENLRRCLNRQKGAILEFFATHKPGDRYHGPDLTDFVKARVPAVAESPTRIQRLLRKSGEINYRCVKRDESLYEVLAVEVKEGKI